jgi:hypothetical protein
MTTQPAGEHHTGSLNLAGQGNPEQPETVRGQFVAILAKHHPITHDEGDGWNEPNQSTLWCTCSCGNDDAEPLDSWIQTAEGDDDQFTRTYAEHLADHALPAIRQQIAEEIAAAIEGQLVGLLDGFQARSAAAAAAREIGEQA